MLQHSCSVGVCRTPWHITAIIDDISSIHGTHIQFIPVEAIITTIAGGTTGGTTAAPREHGENRCGASNVPGDNINARQLVGMAGINQQMVLA